MLLSKSSFKKQNNSPSSAEKNPILNDVNDQIGKKKSKKIPQKIIVERGSSNSLHRSKRSGDTYLKSYLDLYKSSNQPSSLSFNHNRIYGHLEEQYNPKSQRIISKKFSNKRKNVDKKPSRDIFTTSDKDLDSLEQKFINILKEKSPQPEFVKPHTPLNDDLDDELSNWDDDFSEDTPISKDHYLGITKKSNYRKNPIHSPKRVFSGSSFGSYTSRKKKSDRSLAKKSNFTTSSNNYLATKALESEDKVLKDLSIIESLRRNFIEIKKIIEDIIDELNSNKFNCDKISENSPLDSYKLIAEREPSPEEEEVWESWREAESFVIFCGNRSYSNSQDTLHTKPEPQSYCFSDKKQQDLYINQLWRAIVSSIARSAVYSPRDNKLSLKPRRSADGENVSRSVTQYIDSDNEDTLQTHNDSIIHLLPRSFTPAISPKVLKKKKSGNLASGPEQPSSPNITRTGVATSTVNADLVITIEDISVLNKIAAGIIKKSHKSLEKYKLLSRN
ncbi:hypothetical protein AYI68_g3978 [Smittium mucronatum]|uniref:Uncharacterized protein n=1 Tax=Smittium mucronatum TaxID=133383 RepID=A0A1R0GYE4_9FUNG|nr:hypothetical protein AYI68_g3978 [Smittium mucronatum]